MTSSRTSSRSESALARRRAGRELLRYGIVLLGAALAGLGTASAPATDGIGSREIEQTVHRAMDAFGAPGMAVGVVRHGETLYAAGFGVLELGLPDPVDTRTLFRIASASKAFTTAALAVLVEQGRTAWDARVVDHIPEFRMADPWVTAHLSVSDLLAHRSGLAPHAGDLLLWPVPNDFTTADIIGALRHFPLERGFRAGYSYDNLMYIVAGEIVTRSSGLDWGEFVDRSIMRPLGMQRCFAGRIPDREMVNVAAPHARVEGQWTVIERNRTPAEPTKFAPAGGVVCSLGDMLTWVKLQLGRGQVPGGPALFGEAQSRRMWSPNNWLGVGAQAAEWHGTHFSAYGLGWRLRDVHGFQEVGHTGSLDGMRAQVLMLPELELGIVVLVNGSSSDARDAVAYTIEQAFLPAEPRDWVETLRAASEEDQAPASIVAAAPEQAPERVRSHPLPLSQYAGRYADPWFGEVGVRLDGDKLQFSSLRSPQLSGPLEHVSGDIFLARWGDRSMDMDAWVRFHQDEAGGVTSMSLKRAPGEEGGGPDHFQYLAFKRVE